MNYSKFHDRIINRALNRTPQPGMEAHHILPRSLGGKDEPGNLVYLTVKEHYLVHLLLWKQGFDNQIFSVECFINDSINFRRPHRFGQFRWTRRLRRAVTLQRAKNLRETAKLKLALSYSQRMLILAQQAEQAQKQIDDEYAEIFLETVIDTTN
ncbi:HNH endonuclease signature motif containing protein [Variovorax sp. J22R193]|uniref:HNH endonuclease signature motif containing protein n=1 Tax=Variovorax fucosicus TaxID=3053517 RepID=UPI002578CC11|nr:HNH endonuclease signature motif containing protein [Variovorax sp. J22R193]MDM0042167.1 HNH endonuclease signature motif containing protein [Variovorax sp. J22R193]